MRKVIIGASVLSMESAEIAEVLTGSDEVQDEVRDECEASTELALETYSLLRRIAALEDIAEVIETQVQEARPSDVVLVDIATDLAVADTDAEENDVTPGLESAVGKQISTEGIRETIARFVNAIKERVKRIKDQIVANVVTTEKLLKIVRARLEETKQALSAAELSESVSSVPGLGDISVNGKVPKSIAELVKNVSELKRSVNAIYNGYDTDARNFAKDVEAALDVKKDTDRVVLEVLLAIKKTATRRASIASTGEINGHPVVIDTGKYALLNLWPVAAGRLQSLTAKSEDPAKFLHEIRYESTFFTVGTSTHKKAVSKDAKGISFEDVTKASIAKLITEIEAALSFTEAQIKKANESGDALESMYDKMDDYMYSLADTDPTGPVAQKMYLLDETAISAMMHHFEGTFFLTHVARALNSASMAVAKCVKV